MLDAHCQAGFLVGVPFAHEGDYDFKLHGGKRVSQLLGITLWGVPSIAARVRSGLGLPGEAPQPRGPVEDVNLT